MLQGAGGLEFEEYLAQVRARETHGRVLRGSNPSEALQILARGGAAWRKLVAGVVFCDAMVLFWDFWTRKTEEPLVVRQILAWLC